MIQYSRSIIHWQQFITRIVVPPGSLGILATFQVALAMMSPPAFAASRLVTIDDLVIANGRLTVQVPSGHGVVLDLSSVGQIVTGASFGDATKFVISGIDGQLCYMQQDKCEATGASVVAFRPVKGIEISTQSHSPDGSTTATLVTEGRLGRKNLHMRLVPVVKATYTAIVVTGNSTPPVLLANTNTTSRRPQLTNPRASASPIPQRRLSSPIEFPTLAVKPITLPASLGVMEFESGVPSDGETIEVTKPSVVTQTPKPQQSKKIRVTKPSVTARVSNTQSVNPPAKRPAKSPANRSLLLGSATHKSDASTLAIGLSMANPRRNNSIKIRPRSNEYKKVQTAIVKLRRGGTRQQAAKASGLELRIIDQLIYLGQGKAL